MTPCCSRIPLKSPKPTAGFTLIEVLVAVLVLSLGVLGAAGMRRADLISRKKGEGCATTLAGAHQEAWA